MYYTSWGCRSQASASSAPCSLSGGSNGSSGAGHQALVPLVGSAVPAPKGEPPASAPLLPASISLAPRTEIEATSLPPAISAMQSGPMLTVPASQLPANAAAAAALAAGTPGWRTVHGFIIPPPAAPELIPYEEGGRSVCIQWPTVVHATAYTVELLEEGTAAAERFTRAVPEILPEALVELRVGNLNPGAYAACVRCVAPCGCESAPSAWSFLPPVWLPPPPASLGLGWPGAPGQAMMPEPMLAAALGAAAPSTQPAFLSTLLATSPTAPSSAQQLPPPPSAPPSWPATSSAPALAATSTSADDEALVLD